MAKKTIDFDFDIPAWKKVKAQAEAVITDRGKLNERIRLSEEMYFMDFKDDDLETISPDARNKVDQAVMLLTASSPTFSVPKELNNLDADAKSSAMEMAANQMWANSNSEQGRTVEAELAHSGFLYDEMTLRVISTQDLLKAIEENAGIGEGYERAYWEAEMEDAKRTAERTPFLFEPLYPKTAHPEWNRNKQTALVVKTEMRAVDVKRSYGARVGNQLEGKKDWDAVTVTEFFDRVYRFSWIDGAELPLFAESHGLGFLPAASVRVKGRRFYPEIERQNEPFLLTVSRSGTWQAKNVMLSAMTKNVTRLINSGFYYKKAHPDDVLAKVDHSLIGAVVEGEGTLTPIGKDLIPNEAVQFMGLISEMIDESTIRSQDAGIGGSSAFSLAALVSQTRRLPVIPVQKALAKINADGMEIAFRWWKQEGGTYRYVSEFEPKEIPDVIDFDVRVEPDLPQDKLQMASIVATLASGADPIFDKAWAREFMGEGQSDVMQESIWTEQASNAAFGLFMQQALPNLLGMGAPDGPPAPEGASPQMSAEAEHLGGSGVMSDPMNAAQVDQAPPVEDAQAMVKRQQRNAGDI